MEIKNVTITEDMILNVNTPNGFTAVKLRVFAGSRGNVQALVYPQPFTRCHVEPKQAELADIVRLDPSDTDEWPV